MSTPDNEPMDISFESTTDAASEAESAEQRAMKILAAKRSQLEHYFGNPGSARHKYRKEIDSVFDPTLAGELAQMTTDVSLSDSLSDYADGTVVEPSPEVAQVIRDFENNHPELRHG